MIQVPYVIGSEAHPASAGPAALLRAGMVEVLTARGFFVRVRRVARAGPFVDSASAAGAVNRELARCVREAVSAGHLPLVLAGSCDASLGVLGGFEHGQCGVIWIDAHGDFNTPDSTVSGFFPGMSAAILLGDCYAAYWAQLGDARPIPAASMLMLGVRDLSPVAEAERLARSGVGVVFWRNGSPDGDVEARLDELAGRVSEAYLHIDLDGLDPTIAPSTVDASVPGGLTGAELDAVVGGVVRRFRLRALTIATYNPERDPADATRRTCIRVIETLADHLS